MTEYSHTLKSIQVKIKKKKKEKEKKSIQVTGKKKTYYKLITHMWCWLTA